MFQAFLGRNPVYHLAKYSKYLLESQLHRRHSILDGVAFNLTHSNPMIMTDFIIFSLMDSFLCKVKHHKYPGLFSEYQGVYGYVGRHYRLGAFLKAIYLFFVLTEGGSLSMSCFSYEVYFVKLLNLIFLICSDIKS